MAPMVSSSEVVTDRAEDIQRGVWPQGRRERGLPGAEDWHHRVPAMGRGTCPAKCRGRGDGTGAEDGELGEERARNDAANRIDVQ
jgi:hypothetical protein